jgi:hypothetical protein
MAFRVTEILKVTLSFYSDVGCCQEKDNSTPPHARRRLSRAPEGRSSSHQCDPFACGTMIHVANSGRPRECEQSLLNAARKKRTGGGNTDAQSSTMSIPARNAQQTTGWIGNAANRAGSPSNKTHNYVPPVPSTLHRVQRFDEEYPRQT